jgi:hypothetical protein
LIVIMIFCNYLSTNISYVQILCNNLVDHSLSSSVIIWIVKCWSSWIKALNMVDVCACSHSGGMSSLQFIFHHFLPIYKVFVSPKDLSTW